MFPKGILKGKKGSDILASMNGDGSIAGPQWSTEIFFARHQTCTEANQYKS